MFKVKNNQIFKVTEDGNKYTAHQFRGASICDPMFFSKTPEVPREQVIQELVDLGANCVRVPVIPSEQVAKHREYEKELIATLTNIQEQGMTPILVWHFVGNWGGKVMRNCLDFWDDIANISNSIPETDNIVFEVINEPVFKKGKDWGGTNRKTRDWISFRIEVEKVIEQLRYNEFDNLIICGSHSWSGDLTGIADNPIADDNTAYSLHLYPAHVYNSTGFFHEDDWSSKVNNFSKLMDNHPVVITEMGFQVNGDIEGGDREYTAIIRNSLIEKYHLGYVFWSYSPLNGFNSDEDDNWGPNCVEYGKVNSPTKPYLLEAGEVLKNWLAIDNKADEDARAPKDSHVDYKMKYLLLRDDIKFKLKEITELLGE